MTYVLIALAAWRLASLFVNETGPWDMFERLRLAVGLKPGEVTGFLPLLLSCVWCTSVWTGAFAIGLWQVWELPVKVLAISAAAILVETQVRK